MESVGDEGHYGRPHTSRTTESMEKVSRLMRKKKLHKIAQIAEAVRISKATCPKDFQELWFQQDGATCHTARSSIDLLKDTFGDRLISCFGPVNWPPRSCDLTPLDYFLWGYVKSLVYADKPQTLDPLEDNISRVIADIRPQMLEKVIGNWKSRLDYIRASRGSPMPEIIFKM
ncbi:transposable element Tc3 transposase [Trichonephila clavipes]|uniref:Transposable element Tc3 transposase n=1 Tax=Trichonephila clavipes TaxID=2585209 RepID=A0A8X6S7J8_TRICX|nr:transposable element Tc3 transposase [Trichonephila clavipes]